MPALERCAQSIDGKEMDTFDLFQRLSVALAVGLLIGLERGWRERERLLFAGAELGCARGRTKVEVEAGSLRRVRRSAATEP